MMSVLRMEDFQRELFYRYIGDWIGYFDEKN